MLGLISLAATAEAYAPVIPNGTTTSPGDPEPAMTNLGGLACYSAGWGEVTRAAWGLLLLMIPVVARLITQVQQLEDTLGEKPVPASGPGQRTKVNTRNRPSRTHHPDPAAGGGSSLPPGFG